MENVREEVREARGPGQCGPLGGGTLHLPTRQQSVVTGNLTSVILAPKPVTPDKDLSLCDSVSLSPQQE